MKSAKFCYGRHRSVRGGSRISRHGLLLQVKIDDVAEADDLFTKLMGDIVEPRRLFIQENALNVAHLDFLIAGA